ncbi:MAG: TolC family protein [Deltaproteobacteria bacterium]|nr:TolC family protein [Deltaproteobacteria bacterium]
MYPSVANGLAVLVALGIGQVRPSEPSDGVPQRPAQSESAQPASAQPESAQPESAQPESAQPESAQPESAQPESAQPKSALSDLLKEALANNRQLDVSRARIAQAEALVQYAEAQAYPRFSAEVLAGGPLPEARTKVVNDLTTTTPSSLQGDFDFGEMGIALRTSITGVQPLYTFGKISAGKEAANHVVRAAEQELRITEAELALNMVQAFWTLQLTRAFRHALDDGEKTLKKVLERVDALLEAESLQVTENDRMRLRYALATLDVRRTETEGAHQQAETAILLLLGRDQGGRVEIAEAELIDHLPSELPDIDQVVDAARHRRPDLLALREIVKAEEAFTELRRRQFWPDVFLGGAIHYAYQSNATNQTDPFIYDPYNSLDMGVAVGLRLELDVFVKLALLAQAEAQTRLRTEQARLAEEATEFEARLIHRGLATALGKLVGLERSNRTARGWLTTTALGYDIGTGDAKELIDAFLAWAASEAELQKTRFDAIIDFARLAKAMGELSAQ